jgi:hypothetical protein
MKSCRYVKTYRDALWYSDVIVRLYLSNLQSNLEKGIEGG